MLLTMFFLLTPLATACPGAAAHARKLNAAYDESKNIRLDNNGFLSPGLTAVSDYGFGEQDFASFLSTYTAMFSPEPLCYWSYQSLPPPNSDLSTAESDIERFYELANTATDRLVNWSDDILFAGNTVGAWLFPEMCANPVVSADDGYGQPLYCDTEFADNMRVGWPMAIMILNLTSTASETIHTWRAQADGHQPNMNWTFCAGDPDGSQGISITMEDGTVGSCATAGGANVAGWGAGADCGHTGLSSKILPCSSIPEMFINPPFDYSIPEYVRDGMNVSFLEENYEAFVAACGLDIIGGTLFDGMANCVLDPLGSDVGVTVSDYCDWGGDTSSSTDFGDVYVGGDTGNGWTAGFASESARTLEVSVGTNVIFAWTGTHDVVQVDADGLQSCDASSGTSLGNVGPVIFDADTAGTYYFLCSISGHCAAGQHLTLTVTDSSTGSIHAPWLALFVSLILSAVRF